MHSEGRIHGKTNQQTTIVTDYSISSCTRKTFDSGHTLIKNNILKWFLIARGVHRTFATGAACQQRTLTRPDTWSCPTLGLASVLMLRLISPELVLFPDFWVSNIPWYFCFAPRSYHTLITLYTRIAFAIQKEFSGPYETTQERWKWLSYEESNWLRYTLWLFSLFMDESCL